MDYLSYSFRFSYHRVPKTMTLIFESVLEYFELFRRSSKGPVSTREGI